MSKKYKYHKTHTFNDLEGNPHVFVTNLFQIGIYGIFDGRSDCQGNFTPNNLVTIEKKQKKSLENGEITNLVFGIEIIVHEVNGLWEEFKKV